MSRLISIFVLLLIFVGLKSQIVISNLSLTDTTQNIFYIGVENDIHLSGKGYDPVKGKIAISGGGCSAKKLGNGHYTFRCVMETNDCTFWYSENGKTIFKQNFICREVGDIVAKYGGLQDSVATINQLLVNPFLYLAIPGSYYKHNISIISFSATFIYSNADSVGTFAEGNLLTAEQKEIIKKLTRGNKIHFDNIYAVGPDSRRRKLRPFMITIK